MSEIKQIADAYGLSYHSVKKWSKAKRDEAIRNLQAGVNPIIAELVGELQRECYVASQHVGELVWLDVGRLSFNITVLGVRKRIAEESPLNPYELKGAIVKVKELYSHD